MAYILSLDLGTTTCKAIAISDTGSVLASASSTFKMLSPQPGYAEQDAEEVWNSVISALRGLSAKLPAERPVGLSISAAMHSALPMSAENTPLAHAITWADSRFAAQVRAMRSGSTDSDTHTLYQRTGTPLQAPYYPVRLRWLHENMPDVFESAARFVALKDWMLFRLIGEWQTDYSMASAAGLLNLHDFTWDDYALELAGIRAERLCSLASPDTIAGKITPSAAQITGLPEGLPVILGATDGALANLGAGVTGAGHHVITVGTSGAVRTVCDKPLLDDRERTWCYAFLKDSYFAGGAINNGGLALQWVRERFYPDLKGDAGYDQLIADAANVPPGADGVLFLPYFSGERSPHWNADLRGSLHGLALETTRGQIARAVLEGVAFCLADVWDALGRPKYEPACLTGTVIRVPLWGQILADLLNVRLSPVEAADASVIGAAMLGFWALGVLPSRDAAASLTVHINGDADEIVPDAARHALYTERHHAFQALYHDLLDS